MLKFRQFTEEHLYHSTVDPNFNPKKIKPGIHLGTLNAALDRSRHLQTMYPHLKHNRTYEFEHTPTGKSVKIKDNSGENYPDEIHHKLVRRKIIKSASKQINFNDPDEHDKITPYITKELKKKKISHLSYKNKEEDPGSESHIVYDTKSLKHTGITYER